MALTVKVGDLLEETERCGGRTLEVLALKKGHRYKNRYNEGWQMQVRNIRGTKKFWVPVETLYSPAIFARHYQPIHRRY